MGLFLYAAVEYGSGFQSRTTSGKCSIWPQVTCPGSQFIEFSLWHFQVSYTLQLLSKHKRAVQVWRPLPLLWHLFPVPDKQPQHIQGVPSCRPTDHWTYGEARRTPPCQLCHLVESCSDLWCWIPGSPQEMPPKHNFSCTLMEKWTDMSLWECAAWMLSCIIRWSSSAYYHFQAWIIPYSVSP